jgi:tetratricopeptide (TPR) repeat protein
MPEYLNNLGTVFRTRFDRLDRLEDIDLAVSATQKAIDLTPRGHPEMAGRLSNLGTILDTRFIRLGDLRDLDLAVSAAQKAVELTPDGHPDRPQRLSNLGNALGTRFKSLRKPEDLDQAIASKRQAVDLIPDGHPDKAVYLNNFGTISDIRFSCFGNLEDINQAISAKQKALDLTPERHPRRPGYLNNLGNALSTRFSRVGNLEDLHRAISLRQDAVSLAPDGHPDKVSWVHNLCLNLRRRHSVTGNTADLQTAMLLLRDSATSHSGLPCTRFNTAHHWASIAAGEGDSSSAMEAFKVLLGLLPQIVWLGGTVSQRYKGMDGVGAAISQGIELSVRVGQFELALEWLEAGRSIVWGQTLQLRTPMDDLAAVHPELARKLQQISEALDHASAPATSLAMSTPVDSLESQAQARRRLAEDWERTVEETRRLPGFEDFLRPSKFAKLAEGSKHGIVVCLHAYEERCDALILPECSDDIIHLPLPEFTSKKAAALQAVMTGFLSDSNVRVRTTRQGRTLGDIQHVLSMLWSEVVKPIFGALALRQPTVSGLSSLGVRG